MIERKHNRYGPVDVRCDGCADAFLETGEREFAAATVVIRSEGWTSRHLGPAHGWCHFCVDCTGQKIWEVVK